MIKVTQLAIPEVLILEPKIFHDERGYFFESFNDQLFSEAIGHKTTFVQDNKSFSTKNVLRGLHYQENPYSQAKLIRVLHGEIWDVAVDIRQDSVNYGKWVAENLSAENKKQIWIPEGFAHGFCVLTESAEIVYKVNQCYSKSHERVIHWKNNNFNIDWPIAEQDVVISEKDNL